MEYASNGKGNLGVTLGAIGTGLGVLSGGTSLLTGMGGAVNSNLATKEEMKMSMELAAKDSEIALLKADQASEIKMTEVYRQAHSEIAALRDEVNKNRRDQDAWNANQNVLNAQMSAAIATNTNSINSISAIISQITMTKIPNSAVCPGWGTVTVNPVVTGTTIA